MTISPLDLSDAIQDILNEASTEMKNQINDEAKEIAYDVRDNLERHSPKDTGDYAADWVVDEKEGKFYLGTMNYVVHNKKHYRLTHLLEYGHLNRDGSRTPAKEHIAKVEQVANREYERRVEEIIKNGT